MPWIMIGPNLTSIQWDLIVASSFLKNIVETDLCASLTPKS